MNLWSWQGKSSLFFDFVLETSIECFAGFCSNQWVQARLVRIIHRPAKQRVIVPGYSPKNLGTNFWNRMVNRFFEASSGVLLPQQMTEWFTTSWYTKIYYRHHSQARSISCDFNVFQVNIWKSWEKCIQSTEVLFMGLRSMSSGMGGAGILPEKTQNTENDMRRFCKGIVFWIWGINGKTI